METKRARSSGNSNAIPVTIESNTFGTNKFDLSYKRYHIVDTAMYMCTCEPSLSLSLFHSITLSLTHSLAHSLSLPLVYTTITLSVVAFYSILLLTENRLCSPFQFRMYVRLYL